MKNNLNYAGFWTRIMAQNIDVLFAVFVYFILYQFNLSDRAVVISSLIVISLYYILFESSPIQGTPGKHYMKIIVVDKNGERISIWRASLRLICKFLSLSILFIGFSMIEFNERKLGLHDYLAKTRVVFKEKV